MRIDPDDWAALACVVVAALAALGFAEVGWSAWLGAVVGFATTSTAANFLMACGVTSEDHP